MQGTPSRLSEDTPRIVRWQHQGTRERKRRYTSDHTHERNDDNDLNERHPVDGVRIPHVVGRTLYTA